MITAEETLMQACRDAGFTDDYSKMIFRINPDSSNAYVEAIKKYAKEAIKADRINLVPYVEILYYKQDTSIAYVHEYSIINAPNIELL